MNVENDDIDFAAEKTNSRIWFLSQADGVYRIVATSYNNSGQGDYEILIRQYGQAKIKKGDYWHHAHGVTPLPTSPL